MNNLSCIVPDNVSINTCKNEIVDEDYRAAQVFNIFGVNPPDDKVFEGALGLNDKFCKYTKLVNKGK